jgi:5-methylcytosine-specific restriction endonuclease McrA
MKISDKIKNKKIAWNNKIDRLTEKELLNIKNDYLSNMQSKEVRKKYNISCKLFYEILERLGVKRDIGKKCIQHQIKISKYDINKVKDMFYNKKMSTYQIAAYYNSRHDQISRFLKNIGVSKEEIIFHSKEKHKLRILKGKDHPNYVKESKCREYVNQKLWKEKFKKGLEFCAICGTKEKIQLHHIIPYKYTQDNNLDNILPLCLSHHRRIDGMTNRLIKSVVNPNFEELKYILNSIYREKQLIMYYIIKEIIKNKFNNIKRYKLNRFIEYKISQVNKLLVEMV